MAKRRLEPIPAESPRLIQAKVARPTPATKPQGALAPGSLAQSLSLTGHRPQPPSLSTQSPELTPQTLLQLQRQYGNRYVQRLVAQRDADKSQSEAPRLVVQPQLTLGQPGDPYEQEADQVAKQVVSRMAHPTAEAVQRQELEDEDDSVQLKPVLDSVQRQAPEEDENFIHLKPALQTQGFPEGTAVAPDIEATIQRKWGLGQALDTSVKEPMEAAFGVGFDEVQVHTDGEADGLNQALNARAFTTGQDIFFRQGEYVPQSKTGKELLAHELTHVVQQNFTLSDNQFRNTCNQKACISSNFHRRAPSFELPPRNLKPISKTCERDIQARENEQSYVYPSGRQELFNMLTDNDPIGTGNEIRSIEDALKEAIESFTSYRYNGYQNALRQISFNELSMTENQFWLAMLGNTAWALVGFPWGGEISRAVIGIIGQQLASWSAQPTSKKVLSSAEDLFDGLTTVDNGIKIYLLENIPSMVEGALKKLITNKSSPTEAWGPLKLKQTILEQVMPAVFDSRSKIFTILEKGQADVTIHGNK